MKDKYLSKLEDWFFKLFSWVVIIDGEEWRYYYDNDRMPHKVADDDKYIKK